MVFRLKIQLGNDDMCSGADIAASLRETASRISQEVKDPYQSKEGNIRDKNGNTVGEWKLTRR